MLRSFRFALLALPFALTACQDPNKNTDMTSTDYQYTPPPTAKSTETATTPNYTTTYTPPPASTTNTPAYTSDTASTTYTPPPSYTPGNASTGTGSSTMRVADESMAPRTTKSATKSSGRSSGSQTYVVKKGDTLSEIAQKKYGSASKWTKIYNANKSRISDPKKLQVGTKLIIP